MPAVLGPEVMGVGTVVFGVGIVVFVVMFAASKPPWIL